MSVARTFIRPSLALAALVLGLAARPALADEAMEKPINTLVKSVRFNKDDLALKQLDSEAQGLFLFGDNWGKAKPEQRAEFTSLFQRLFAGIAFPKIRENLQNLSTTLYEKPTITGDKAQIVSTIVIDHPLKKQEMKVRYDLHKAKEGWKVVDVTVLEAGTKSMLTSVKDQTDPLFKSGGWDNLLAKMRDRAAKLPPAKK
jgi:phospholipid transport system substrate-binding protein